MSSILNKDVQMAATCEQIRSCFKVMQQLRPHLKEEEAFVEQVQRQMEEGYHLAYTLEKEEVVALAGFRFGEFLAWGRILYIDDLITDSKRRKNGHAGTLLKWLIELAREKGCQQVHLDSGSQRHDAHRLYLNHGFKIIGHHFALEVIDLV